MGIGAKRKVLNDFDGPPNSVDEYAKISYQECDDQGDSDEIAYDAKEQRARIRQEVRQFIKSLNDVWCDNEEKPGKSLSSLSDMMQYSSLPAFFKKHCWAAFRVGVTVGGGVFLLWFLALTWFNPSPEYLDAQSAAISLKIGMPFIISILVVAIVTFAIRSGKIADDLTEVKTNRIIAESKIRQLCSDFLEKKAGEIKAAEGPVEATVSDHGKSKRVKLSLVDTMTHWRTLERITHYARHEWDIYIRDCRDKIFLPKYSIRRQQKYAPEIFAFLVFLLIALSLLQRSMFSSVGGLPDLIQASVGLILLVSTIISVCFGMAAVGHYKKSSDLVYIYLTEALQMHKKESALSIIDLPFKRWLELTDRKSDGSWDGWTPDYSEQKRLELDSELSGNCPDENERVRRIEQVMANDDTLYIGNSQNIRFRILLHDPIESLTKKIPKIGKF